VNQGDGIELKEGSYNNIIRDNVIHDTNYPCILTYSTVGNGAPNIIERNVLWNCGDHAIQSAADAVIRNNIILSANVDGIAMQPHQAGAPSNHVIVHNTVLQATNDAISLRGTTGSVVIANNAVYAESGRAIFVSGGDTSGLVVAGNVGVGGLEGTSDGLTDGDLAADFVAAHFNGAPPIDVFPAAGSGLIAAGDPSHVATDDFNGTARQGVADVGAYAYADSGNPGWTLGEGFKGGGTPISTGGAPPAGPGLDSSESDSGCSCRAASSARVPVAGWLWIAVGAALAGRARRRRSRSRR
jgi:MYXO-CTERM domain-containing protein